MKKAITGAKDFPPLMNSGFALRQINGTFYLTRGLPGGAQPTENILDNKPATQKSIFISYS